MQPIYVSARQAAPRSLGEHSNAGLWFTRFYNAFDNNWQVPAGKDGKQGWIDGVTSAGKCGDSASLGESAKKLERLSLALSAERDVFKTEWHFATGLGISHPVENGFAWHHTLGVPYLPASGVKGLLRGWVEEWMEPDNENPKDQLLARWFGVSSSSAVSQDEGAGNLIFFDALPVEPVLLACDVMTPHMGKWYEKGDQITPANFADVAPADWHSPVPVHFLVVRDARFQFMIAPRRIGNAEKDQQALLDVKLAMAQLAEALQFIGAGAKTAAGYGRMLSAKVEQARKEAEGLQALNAAGIKLESTVWVGAKATWDKGKSSLTLLSGSDKATASGEAAKSLFATLSESAQKKLKDGKKLTLDVTVDIKGNMVSILSLKEIQ